MFSPFSDGGYDFRFNTSIHHPPKGKYSTVGGLRFELFL